MKVTFTSIDYKASLKEEDFVLEQYITEDTENSIIVSDAYAKKNNLYINKYYICIDNQL